MPSPVCECSHCAALVAHPAPRRYLPLRDHLLARAALHLNSVCPLFAMHPPHPKIQQRTGRDASRPVLFGALAAFCILLLAACQPLSNAASTDSVATPLAAQGATDASSAPPALATLTVLLPELAQIAPLSDAEATVAALLPTQVTPVHIAIAAAGLETPVQPLGWERYTGANGAGTRWVLPVDAAGWHSDSARPGEAGTMVISGAQLDGGVFAPVALGDVQVGQTVQVVDSTGTEHRYRVSEVSQPIALQGDAGADAHIAEIMQQTTMPRLLLITGWPDFTTTHRIFVVAEEAP